MHSDLLSAATGGLRWVKGHTPPELGEAARRADMLLRNPAMAFGSTLLPLVQPLGFPKPAFSLQLLFSPAEQAPGFLGTQLIPSRD